MQIKKYFAPTLKEALENMKRELGEEAIVLSTRTLEGNPKVGQERMFEITAGLDSESIVPDKEVEQPKKSFEDELRKMSERFEKKPQANKLFQDRIAAYKKNEEKDNELSEKVKEILIERDVDSKYVNKILKQFDEYAAFINETNYEQYILSTIAALIPTSGFELQKKGFPKIISLVGPTGVGKTTCIAKLAVISKILHNLDIGLISIDTYRLGAIDQLKIFSEISNIDFGVAYEPTDLVKLVEKYKKKDLIFIDTAGRSQNNTLLLEDIKKFTSCIKIDETYLVLNSSASGKTLMDVAEKFNILNYSSLIFTKLDEAVTYGAIFNIANEMKVPIKYLTNGQTIPDDILAADPEFIANLIYSGRINQ